ncbi:MAG: CarD family transcriptional regulator, partial [Clostridiales bacterium]|nr:CarD family transcriptional regulator [Clostridiales bacterium]
DYIMYGTTGVCKISDITNEKFINGEHRKYYVLTPIYCNDTIIKTPVDNKKVSMRKIISKEDAHLLINSIPNMELYGLTMIGKETKNLRPCLKVENVKN